MILTDEQKFVGGNYQVTVEANGGTAALQTSTDGLSFQTIPDASWSADTVVQIDIAESILKPVLTGGAVISVKNMPTITR